MGEVTVGGNLYRVGRLDARKQLHIARRLANTPISILIGTNEDQGGVPDEVRKRAEEAGVDVDTIRTQLPRLIPSLSLRSLGELSEADCDYVINACLSACHRRTGVNGVESWIAIYNVGAGSMQFQDIELSGLLELTVAVLRENLGSFFAGTPSPSLGQSGTPQVLTG